MRTIIAASALAFGLGAPAMAADPFYSAPQAGNAFYSPMPIAFHAELGLGALFGSSTSGIFEGALRGAVPLYGTLHAELEGTATTPFGSNENNALAAGTYVHLFHKVPQAAIGGFVGVGSPAIAPFSAGLEAFWLTGQWLWSGQVAYHFAGTNSNITQLRGGVAYYMTPNHKVGLYVNYATSPSRSATEIGINGEKLIDGTPISVYGRLAYTTSTGTGSGNGVLVLVGGRYFFGTQTLQDADQAVPFSVKLPITVGHSF